MRQYFTSLQVFIAAALSVVVFVGILWVEYANFRRASQLENPFDAAIKLNERVVVSEDKPRVWLHDTGELFLVTSGSKFNLINQARELEDGTIFINTNFQLESGIVSAKKGFPAPYDLAEKSLGPGQVRVGPIVVSVPQGMAVIRRDLVRQELEVYAHDHPVDIYLPGASNPFMVAPGHMILLKESRANLLGGLYFSKLKKELNLEVLTSETSGADPVQSALMQGLQVSVQWEALIIDYADQVVLTWQRFAPDSIMGRLNRGLRYIQRYYAVGVDQHFKQEYQFEVLKQDLADAYFAIDSSNAVLAEEAAQAFHEEQATSEWARFFVEHPSQKLPWDQFARTQRVWFQYIFPESEIKTMLGIIWGPPAELGAFDDFVGHYFMFEKYYVQGYRKQAQEQLSFIRQNFETANPQFKASDHSKITRMRRQLSLMLKNDPTLQTRSNMILYSYLIESELSLIKENEDMSQEMRLEVAQELLFFLQNLLDSITKKDAAFVLLESYRKLEIGKLSESLGRTVFSAQERSTLDKIESYGNISDEDLAAIRDSNRTADEAIRIRRQLEEQERQETQYTGPIGVQTGDALVEFLQNAGVQTQGISVEVSGEGDRQYISFSQASYDSYKLQGTFQTATQNFSFLKLGEETENRANTDNVGAFLMQMMRANDRRADTVVEEEDTGPNNYTSTAVITRNNILRMLKQQGVSVKQEDILMTNKALTEASVERATFESQYLLHFDFDLGPPERIRNVTVEFGRSTILLPGQVFALEDFGTKLKAAIDAKLQAEEAEREALKDES